MIFQERVDVISGEDRLLTKRIFELREAAQQASLAGGGVEMFQLSQELEVLINRQRALVQEKDEHERHIKWVFSWHGGWVGRHFYSFQWELE